LSTALWPSAPEQRKNVEPLCRRLVRLESRREKAGLSTQRTSPGNR
jgi:hypothetical protein